MMDTLVASMHAAPISSARPDTEPASQTRNQGDRVHVILDPCADRSDATRYPQYRNYSISCDDAMTQTSSRCTAWSAAQATARMKTLARPMIRCSSVQTCHGAGTTSDPTLM